MPSPANDRQRHRLLVAENAALLDLLNELYPATRLPDLNATEREIGAWLGERRLIERLNTLRQEALQGSSGSLPRVIGG